MPPLRGFYNPRNPFRTPGFAPDGLMEDEQQEQPSLQMAAASRSYTPAEPDKTDEPPAQPQRRSIDLSGELDRIKRAPAPPKVGKLRNVLGTLAGLYIPQIGEAIKRPGYADQMREFQADQEYANNRIGAMGKLATAEAGFARAGAEDKRGSAEDARRDKLRAEAGQVGRGIVTVNRNERALDKATRKVVLEAEESPEKLPNSLEAAAARALSEVDPVKRKETLDRIKEAHNILNPEKPITKIVVGDDGKITAVSVKPSDAGNGKVVGNVYKRPPAAKADTTEDSDEDLIADLVSDNPRNDWNRLGVKTRDRIRNALTKRGWQEPANLSAKQKETVANIDSIVPRLKSILAEYNDTGSISGSGRFVGRLPDEAVSTQGVRNRVRMGDIFSQLANVRSGGAIPEPEMERIDAFLGSQNRSDKFNAVSFQELLESLERSKAIITGKSGASLQGGKSDKANKPPAAPAAGSVEMTKVDPATGKKTTRMVSPDKVEAALKLGYVKK